MGIAKVEFMFCNLFRIYLIIKGLNNVHYSVIWLIGEVSLIIIEIIIWMVVFVFLTCHVAS